MYRLRIDPHVHGEASYDGHEPVELLLEQAADIGLDGIVVTDHDRIEASRRAAQLAPDYGLVGIPGVEVSTADGHLLALGVEEQPPRGRPLGETVRWVHDADGVAVVPHSFQRLRHGVSRRTLADCDPPPDAIETYNSWLLTGVRNRRARRFADARGLPGVAASDAHRVGFAGQAYTEVDVEERSAGAVLDAFRTGATRVRGRRTPIPVSTRHYAVGAAGKSGYYARAGALRSAALARAAAVLHDQREHGDPEQPARTSESDHDRRMAAVVRDHDGLPDAVAHLVAEHMGPWYDGPEPSSGAAELVHTADMVASTEAVRPAVPAPVPEELAALGATGVDLS